MQQRVFRGLGSALSFALLIGLISAAPASADETRSKDALLLVVMDPLALPLSCPCVEGYAQRDYEKLAAYLRKRLGQSVDLVFAESLSQAKERKPGQTPAVIIGKDSVVRADAKAAGLAVTRVAALTGKDGLTTQTGLVVVASEDPAKTVADLKQHRIIFGSAISEEKYQAAIALLRAADVSIPEKIETSLACSDGACKVLDLRGKERAAAVISSYAKPLLEGCGTVEKGALRVVGETKPVSFITAYVAAGLPADIQAELRENLLQVGDDPALCTALESLIGFVPPETKLPAAGSKKNG